MILTLGGIGYVEIFNFFMDTPEYTPTMRKMSIELLRLRKSKIIKKIKPHKKL